MDYSRRSPKQSSAFVAIAFALSCSGTAERHHGRENDAATHDAMQNDATNVVGSGGDSGRVTREGSPDVIGSMNTDGASAGGLSGMGDAAVSNPEAGSPCTLTASGPVSAAADGEVIELLSIESTSGAAISVTGYHNVTVRNVVIRHSGGPGIDFSNADDLVIENVSIEQTSAPASGPNSSSDLNNINGYQSARVHITNVRLSRGSSGIYLVESPDSYLSFIEGYDFRGPFPRGQLVQWDKSNDGVLEDFSVVDTSDSWTEDNVNVYQSTGLQIRRGLVDGNNSPSGVGVIFDGGTSTGVVEDVDAVHMGNGCFSGYAGADGNIFRRTRCRDNICGDQGRGAPLSNGLMWSGSTTLSMLRIEQSTYFNACNPGNIVWPSSSFVVADVTEVDFTPRAPLALAFCWE